MTYYITQAGKEFLEEGRIGDVVKKVKTWASRTRKSIFRTKKEKAASKAKLQSHKDASDAQSAKSTAATEDKEKAAAAAKAAEAKAKEPYSGPRVPHPQSKVRGGTGETRGRRMVR
jgi:hypothetical protein